MFTSKRCALQINQLSPCKGILYTIDGELKTFSKRNTFRKMINLNESHGRVEIRIYNWIQQNQDEIVSKSIGIVKIKELTDTSVDMELLNIDLSNFTDSFIKAEMSKVKDYLQSIGIMYIDWKYDNIGVSRLDGRLKLFDFDGSGLTNSCKSKWTITPQDWWIYKKAIIAGIHSPIEIDNYAFENGF